MTRFHRFILALATLCAGLFIASAHADMTVEIVGGGSNQYPIALPAFVGENTLPGGITPVISSDLARSVVFRVIDSNAVANTADDPSKVDYPAWKGAGAFSVAIGNVVAQANGQYAVSFWLMDITQKKVLTSGVFTIAPNQTRQLAHRIADMIYQAITGDRGIFSTQIAYVLQASRSSYLLQVADADGMNAQTLLKSKQPIISPSWSPDGKELAYVSFETKKPVVYVQNILSGARRAAANFKGSNSAPAWSPDGNRLAVVLTVDGNSQIYTLNARDGSGLTRVTNSQGIDTEPTFTPDGTRIVFVSDRAGGPQIYSTPVNGGPATRITYEGNYNVSPHISPDGKYMTFVRRESGNFRTMVQELSAGQANSVSDTNDDESPSFAPNGKMVLFASTQGGRGVLYCVTRDGLSKSRLTTTGGSVQEPAWGPFPPKPPTTATETAHP